MEPISTLVAVLGGAMSLIGAVKALQLRNKEDAEEERAKEPVHASYAN
jgi:hypothetical protein